MTQANTLSPDILAAARVARAAYEHAVATPAISWTPVAQRMRETAGQLGALWPVGHELRDCFQCHEDRALDAERRAENQRAGRHPRTYVTGWDAMQRAATGEVGTWRDIGAKAAR